MVKASLKLLKQLSLIVFYRNVIEYLIKKVSVIISFLLVSYLVLLIIFVSNYLTKDFAIGDDYHFLTFWGNLHIERSLGLYESLILDPFSLGRVLQTWFNPFIFPDFVENVSQLTYIRLANILIFLILINILTKIIFKNASVGRQLIVLIILLCNPSTLHLLLMSYGFPIFMGIILSLVVGKMLTHKMGLIQVLVSIFIFNLSLLLYQPSILLALLPISIIKLENPRKFSLFSFDKLFVFPAFVISIFLNILLISKIDSPRSTGTIDLNKLDLNFVDTSLFPYRIIDFVFFNSTNNSYFSIFIILSYLIFLINFFLVNRFKYETVWNYTSVIILSLGLLFNFFILLVADLNDDYRKFFPGWIFTIATFLYVIYSSKSYFKFFVSVGAFVALINLFYFQVFVIDIAVAEWSNSRKVSSMILLPEASTLYSELIYDCYKKHLYTEELSGSTFLHPSSIMMVLQFQYDSYPNNVVMNPWETVFDQSVVKSSNWSQTYLDLCTAQGIK